MNFKIGIGYDVHRLVEGRKLFIGGIEIPYVKGLLGHSDGDVLIHAICDALLGALAEGDIGEHFPDNDPQYENISSGELLKKVYALLKDKGFAIGNIDAVIIAQQPCLLPFKKKMQTEISRMLEIHPDCVNIKAKTNNGLGLLGEKEAIASYVAVMINKE